MFPRGVESSLLQTHERPVPGGTGLSVVSVPHEQPFIRTSQTGASFGARLQPDPPAYFCSVGVVALGGAAVVFCCTVGAGAGSLMPFRPSLKPLSPSPNPLPSSGSRLAPNSRNATAASTIRCHGCNRSPIFIPSAHPLSRRAYINDYCRTKARRRASPS